jgi:hypothetical protein
MSIVAAKYFSARFSFLNTEFYKGDEAQGWGHFSVQRLVNRKASRLPLQTQQLQASKSIAPRHFSIK